MKDLHIQDLMRKDLSGSGFHNQKRPIQISHINSYSKCNLRLMGQSMMPSAKLAGD